MLPSVAALAQMVQEAGGGLGLFTEAVTELLRDAPLVNFDETGAPVEARLHWVHVASSCLDTPLMVHRKRGDAAIDERGVMATMTGVARHDGWKPYRSYDVVHQLCNAHYAEPAIMRMGFHLGTLEA